MLRRPNQHPVSRAIVEACEHRTLLAAQLVTDVNTTPAVTDAPNLVQMSVNASLFAWNDRINGTELWRTDGTNAGTAMVKDITPGPVGSDIVSLVSAKNGQAFFVVGNGSTVNQLWRSDGSEAGTQLVKDFSGGGYSLPTQLTPAGDRLFFVMSHPTLGGELYVSDGTSAGTTLVKDINPGTAGTTITNISPIRNGVMFGARVPQFGTEPWFSDGTEAGTAMVGDLTLGHANSDPYAFTESNGQIFYATVFDSYGFLHRAMNPLDEPTQMMFVTDGALGTLTDLNGVLMFNTTTFAREELWRSDGTIAGTTKVIDIRTTTSGAGLVATNFANMNGVLYFTANNGTQGLELWKTDGTVAGSGLVRDIYTGATGSRPEQFTHFNGRVYFSALTSANGQELWSTDGTNAGTAIVTDLVTPGSTRPLGLSAIDGQLVFSARTAAFGQAIWASDGSAPGTVVGSDLPDPNLSSTPTFVPAIGDKVVMYATTPTGVRTFITDGTPAGTFMVPGGVSTTVARIGDRFVYTSFDAAIGNELWWSDGTPTGASLIKNIRAGSAGSNPNFFSTFNGVAYFSADDGAGAALWRIDGTSKGTVKISSATGVVSVGVVANNTLFIKGTGGLWKSDGTTGGTVKVNSGTLAITSDLVAASDGTVFFMVSDQLWRSNGTAAGTVMVKDLTPTGVTTAIDLQAFGPSGVTFVAFDPVVSSYFVWVSDGTTNGTIKLRDLVTGTRPLDTLHVMDGRIYFAAYEQATGTELWSSDGTVAGTMLFKDVRPGALSSNVSATHHGPGGRLYFVADDGVRGDELWSTDGTPVGTTFVQDINPGRAGIDPGHGGEYSVAFAVTRDGGKLFFAADDGAHGREPWVFVPTPAPPFAYIQDSVLHVTGTTDADAIGLDFTPTDVSVVRNGDTLSFALGAFTAIRVAADDGDDTLTITAPGAVASTIRFEGGDGADSFVIASGSLVFPQDANAGGDEFALTVLAGATATFASTQHLAALNVTGTARFTATDGVLVVRSLAIADDGVLDLNANSLIIDYTADVPSPMVGVVDQIRTARAGGAWTGIGLTSSAARDNALHNTTLGAMESTDFKSIYGSSALFTGEAIDTTAVLVKYTYYGDADFNGVVNFDDYARIDAGFLNARTGWLNGDFDGNGSVNFDDYSLIDLAFNTQGPVLRSGSPSPSENRLSFCSFR